MSEVGQFMRETGCKIALLHEPYTLHGDVCGLPLEMLVFRSMDGRTAIAVDNVSIV